MCVCLDEGEVCLSLDSNAGYFNDRVMLLISDSKKVMYTNLPKGMRRNLTFEQGNRKKFKFK